MQNKQLEDYYKKINESSVYDVAIETPLLPMQNLSLVCNNEVLIKREDLQPIFSFKLRGAYNKISQLTKDELKSGIIASSAGNHAQGVAYSAKKLGIKATIVMPNTTPPIKVKSVISYGAKTVLFGDMYDDAYMHAQELAKKEGLTFIHPYDDEAVIAGQGTVGLELLKQAPDMDIIFVPVGGGGLLAGILAAIKYKNPKIKVVGVEPENAACLFAALNAKERVILKQVGIFADGVAVKQIGELPFKVIKEFIDDVVLVSTDEICAAIKDIFENSRTIAEPAGALSLAGLKKYADEQSLNDKKLVCINSGANINFDRLRHIAERADVGEQKEAIYSITIPEEKGGFLKFCTFIKKRSITEFNYRYCDDSMAHLFVGIGLDNGIDDKLAFERNLDEQGYDYTDLTDNELAKLHIRHMIGGKPKVLTDEKVYRFQFPERPGALMEFLKTMGDRWNISMFHYRNHGSAYGRVFVGIQLPIGETTEFSEFLEKLNYSYFDESKNQAYLQFL
ncbi:threonine ammonia-lyase, biosynthetic [Candidatus Marinamargulisbacteria bacterium SCGC AAA071-K20]|nr:threonine ammonia-lyase, biosynthetic [Candidatus Marinamargulisbacteria bacterium SCGC AAA071-K20]